MRNDRLVCLSGIPEGEAEKISLLFQILGWTVASSASVAGRARLTMSAVGNIIEVAVDDGGISHVLAAAGLDRLVMPVPLPALEQLMVFAG